jgi:hypothetical protein
VHGLSSWTGQKVGLNGPGLTKRTETEAAIATPAIASTPRHSAGARRLSDRTGRPASQSFMAGHRHQTVDRLPEMVGHSQWVPLRLTQTSTKLS